MLDTHKEVGGRGVGCVYLGLNGSVCRTSEWNKAKPTSNQA